MLALNILGATNRARPADLRPDFPETCRAARHAALLWFQSDTGMILSQFRDVRFWEHSERHDYSGVEKHLREAAFRKAFAEQVGQVIVERHYETTIT